VCDILVIGSFFYLVLSFDISLLHFLSPYCLKLYFIFVGHHNRKRDDIMTQYTLE